MSKSMSGKSQNLSKNQAGIVSFIVVIIIMFILSLIVLAFARLVRREQTQTLDRQLNSQAFYAAESGVNDALNALKSASPPAGLDQCSGANSFMNWAGLNGDLGNGVSYSCLLVDNTLPALNFDNISDVSTVVPLQAEGGVPIDTVVISWEDTVVASPNLSGCPAAGVFPSSWDNANCQIGMLRIELVPFGTTPVGRDTLITNRAIAFLQPRTGSGQISSPFSSITGNGQGLRAGVLCNGSGPRRCTFTITSFNSTLAYLRMRSIYRSAAVTVSATRGGVPVNLVGAQAEVDVTGRASGVLKRIKVSVPIPSGGTDPLPEYALQSSRTQCKRFTWRPGAGGTAPDWGIAPDTDYCHPLLP